jgi:hypothetical protein
MVILLGLQSTVRSAAFPGSIRPIGVDDATSARGHLHARLKDCNMQPILDTFEISKWNRRGVSLRGGSDEAVQKMSDNGGAKPSSLRREMLAELIGTFLIVQLGTGSVMSAVYTDSLVGLFQIASVWMVAVTVAICTTASISGAHLNPAISVCFRIVKASVK